MKLKSNQLSQHLKRQGLAAIYLLTGDEPLQLMECTDTLRNFARQQGFTERIVLTVETGFDWGSLHHNANTFSLFANKRLLELRLGNKSPCNEGGKALLDYANKLPTDTVLLITADKLDASQQKTKWFNILDEKGIIIQIRPLEFSQLPVWINQRLEQYRLQASDEVINMIAECSEGHLLAGAQEIEKLHLLYGSGQISIEQAIEAVADSARFELFNWIDIVLGGDGSRAVRQLTSLRAEGVEPVLVIWILNKEIRQLCQITHALQTGQRLEQLFKTYQIWSTRRAVITKCINRYPPQIWRQQLQETVQIERIIKGVAPGNPWDELEKLSLRVAGVKLMVNSEF